MANAKKVRDSMRSFIEKMKAHDAAIPEELAEDALEMVEEVSDALCEDEEANPLEVTTDSDVDIGEIEKNVTDGVLRALRAAGVIKDPSMKALDELEVEEAEDEDPDLAEDEDGEESVTVDPETAKDSATLLRTMKPMIAKIKNPRERKAAADALAKLIKMNGVASSGNTTSAYADIMKAAKHNSKDSAESKKKTADADYDFGMDMAKRFNPHYKEVK